MKRTLGLQKIKRLVLLAMCLSSPLLWAEKPAASQEIDQILAAHWKANGVKPEPLVSDEVFLRRAYLNLAGRIPSYEESEDWLADPSPEKRLALVDQLVDSEGFVSHQFNLWADALRIRTTGREGDISGGKYFVPWLKNQLRANRPYDDWVREILSAEGAPWDNPASSYFLRDQGMPLDNMALTMQVFLGTQMQCAQCHNHPTDVWSRRDFYEMAAFRYSIDTRIGYDRIEALKPVVQELVDRQGDKLSDKEKKKPNVNRLLNPAGRDLFNQMVWQTNYTGRKLQFPHDYQYEDVQPKSQVEPHTIFGETPDTKELSPKQRVDFYAEWITSGDNPRFAKVIAHRIWKSAMGRSPLEPIDDLREDTQSTVPGLDEKLTATMRAVNFDLKEYYRILAKTDYFQRGAVVFDAEKPEEYHFTGPVLRRMSAEQMWDSYVVLIDPTVDQRPEGYQDVLPPPPGPVQILNTFTPAQMADYLDSAEKAWNERQDARTAFYKIRNDQDLKGTDEYKKLEQAHRDAEKTWRTYSQIDAAMTMMGASMEGEDAASDDKKKDKKEPWYLRNLHRAADLNSPENVDHWLRVFGQSDRDIVDNADYSSTINQALLLLNSGETNGVVTEYSDPAQRVKKAKDPQEAIEILAMGFLTREPTEKEIAYTTSLWETDPNKARQRMAWAMINTQEFFFIQ